MSKRTDIHSPSKMIPANYRHILSYSDQSTVDGDPIDPIGLQELSHLHDKYEENFVNIHPTDWQCDCCGRIFVHGSVFQHKSSGDMLNIGHTCADKIGLVTNQRVWKDLRKMAIREAKQKMYRRTMRYAMRNFLIANPEVSDLLRVNHRITKSIRQNFIQWGKLSQKQIDLLKKLRDQVTSNPVKEIPVPAHILDGRHEIIGKVMGTKETESYFGYYAQTVTKGFIIVETPEGQWKTWGTIPEELCYTIDHNDEDRKIWRDPKGCVVKFTARFSVAKGDNTMSFFNRPTKASIVEVK